MRNSNIIKICINKSSIYIYVNHLLIEMEKKVKEIVLF